MQSTQLGLSREPQGDPLNPHGAPASEASHICALPAPLPFLPLASSLALVQRSLLLKSHVDILKGDNYRLLFDPNLYFKAKVAVISVSIRSPSSQEAPPASFPYCIPDWLCPFVHGVGTTVVNPKTADVKLYSQSRGTLTCTKGDKLIHTRDIKCVVAPSSLPSELAAHSNISFRNTHTSVSVFLPLSLAHSLATAETFDASVIPSLALTSSRHHRGAAAQFRTYYRGLADMSVLCGGPLSLAAEGKDSDLLFLNEALDKVAYIKPFSSLFLPDPRFPATTYLRPMHLTTTPAAGAHPFVLPPCVDSTALPNNDGLVAALPDPRLRRTLWLLFCAAGRLQPTRTELLALPRDICDVNTFNNGCTAETAALAALFSELFAAYDSLCGSLMQPAAVRAMAIRGRALLGELERICTRLTSLLDDEACAADVLAMTDDAASPVAELRGLLELPFYLFQPAAGVFTGYRPPPSSLLSTTEYLPLSTTPAHASSNPPADTAMVTPSATDLSTPLLPPLATLPLFEHEVGCISAEAYLKLHAADMDAVDIYAAAAAKYTGSLDGGAVVPADTSSAQRVLAARVDGSYPLWPLLNAACSHISLRTGDATLHTTLPAARAQASNTVPSLSQVLRTRTAIPRSITPPTSTSTSFAVFTIYRPHVAHYLTRFAAETTQLLHETCMAMPRAPARSTATAVLTSALALPAIPATPTPSATPTTDTDIAADATVIAAPSLTTPRHEGDTPVATRDTLHPLPAAVVPPSTGPPACATASTALGADVQTAFATSTTPQRASRLPAVASTGAASPFPVLATAGNTTTTLVPSAPALPPSWPRRPVSSLEDALACERTQDNTTFLGALTSLALGVLTNSTRARTILLEDGTTTTAMQLGAYRSTRLSAAADAMVSSRCELSSMQVAQAMAAEDCVCGAYAAPVLSSEAAGTAQVCTRCERRWRRPHWRDALQLACRSARTRHRLGMAFRRAQAGSAQGAMTPALTSLAAPTPSAMAARAVSLSLASLPLPAETTDPAAALLLSYASTHGLCAVQPPRPIHDTATARILGLSPGTPVSAPPSTTTTTTQFGYGAAAPLPPPPPRKPQLPASGSTPVTAYGAAGALLLAAGYGATTPAPPPVPARAPTSTPTPIGAGAIPDNTWAFPATPYAPVAAAATIATPAASASLPMSAQPPGTVQISRLGRVALAKFPPNSPFLQQLDTLVQMLLRAHRIPLLLQRSCFSAMQQLMLTATASEPQRPARLLPPLRTLVPHADAAEVPAAALVSLLLDEARLRTYLALLMHPPPPSSQASHQHTYSSWPQYTVEAARARVGVLGRLARMAAAVSKVLDDAHRDAALEHREQADHVASLLRAALEEDELADNGGRSCSPSHERDTHGGPLPHGSRTHSRAATYGHPRSRSPSALRGRRSRSCSPSASRQPQSQTTAPPADAQVSTTAMVSLPSSPHALPFLRDHSLALLGELPPLEHVRFFPLHALQALLPALHDAECARDEELRDAWLAALQRAKAQLLQDINTHLDAVNADPSFAKITDALRYYQQLLPAPASVPAASPASSHVSASLAEHVRTHVDVWLLPEPPHTDATDRAPVVCVNIHVIQTFPFSVADITAAVEEHSTLSAPVEAERARLRPLMPLLARAAHELQSEEQSFLQRHQHALETALEHAHARKRERELAHEREMVAKVRGAAEAEAAAALMTPKVEIDRVAGVRMEDMDSTSVLVSLSPSAGATTDSESKSDSGSDSESSSTSTSTGSSTDDTMSDSDSGSDSASGSDHEHELRRRELRRQLVAMRRNIAQQRRRLLQESVTTEVALVQLPVATQSAQEAEDEENLAQLIVRKTREKRASKAAAAAVAEVTSPPPQPIRAAPIPRGRRALAAVAERRADGNRDAVEGEEEALEAVADVAALADEATGEQPEHVAHISPTSRRDKGRDRARGGQQRPAAEARRAATLVVNANTWRIRFERGLFVYEAPETPPASLSARATSIYLAELRGEPGELVQVDFPVLYLRRKVLDMLLAHLHGKGTTRFLFRKGGLLEQMMSNHLEYMQELAAKAPFLFPPSILRALLPSSDTESALAAPLNVRRHATTIRRLSVLNVVDVLEADDASAEVLYDQYWALQHRYKPTPHLGDMTTDYRNYHHREWWLSGFTWEKYAPPSTPGTDGAEDDDEPVLLPMFDSPYEYGVQDVAVNDMNAHPETFTATARVAPSRQCGKSAPPDIKAGRGGRGGKAASVPVIALNDKRWHVLSTTHPASCACATCGASSFAKTIEVLLSRRADERQAGAHSLSTSHHTRADTPTAGATPQPAKDAAASTSLSTAVGSKPAYSSKAVAPYVGALPRNTLGTLVPLLEPSQAPHPLRAPAPHMRYPAEAMTFSTCAQHITLQTLQHSLTELNDYLTDICPQLCVPYQVKGGLQPTLTTAAFPILSANGLAQMVRLVVQGHVKRERVPVAYLILSPRHNHNAQGPHDIMYRLRARGQRIHLHEVFGVPDAVGNAMRNEYVITQLRRSQRATSLDNESIPVSLRRGTVHMTAHQLRNLSYLILKPSQMISAEQLTSLARAGDAVIDAAITERSLNPLSLPLLAQHLLPHARIADSTKSARQLSRVGPDVTPATTMPAAWRLTAHPRVLAAVAATAVAARSPRPHGGPQLLLPGARKGPPERQQAVELTLTFTTFPNYQPPPTLVTSEFSQAYEAYAAGLFAGGRAMVHPTDMHQERIRDYTSRLVSLHAPHAPVEDVPPQPPSRGRGRDTKKLLAHDAWCQCNSCTQTGEACGELTPQTRWLQAAAAQVEREAASAQQARQQLLDAVDPDSVEFAALPIGAEIGWDPIAQQECFLATATNWDAVYAGEDEEVAIRSQTPAAAAMADDQTPSTLYTCAMAAPSSSTELPTCIQAAAARLSPNPLALAFLRELWGWSWPDDEEREIWHACFTYFLETFDKTTPEFAVNVEGSTLHELTYAFQQWLANTQTQPAADNPDASPDASSHLPLPPSPSSPFAPACSPCSPTDAAFVTDTTAVDLFDVPAPAPSSAHPATGTAHADDAAPSRAADLFIRLGLPSCAPPPVPPKPSLADQLGAGIAVDAPGESAPAPTDGASGFRRDRSQPRTMVDTRHLNQAIDFATVFARDNNHPEPTRNALVFVRGLVPAGESDGEEEGDAEEEETAGASDGDGDGDATKVTIASMSDSEAGEDARVDEDETVAVQAGGDAVDAHKEDVDAIEDEDEDEDENQDNREPTTADILATQVRCGAFPEEAVIPVDAPPAHVTLGQCLALAEAAVAAPPTPVFVSVLSAVPTVAYTHPETVRPHSEPTQLVTVSPCASTAAPLTVPLATPHSHVPTQPACSPTSTTADMDAGAKESLSAFSRAVSTPPVHESAPTSLATVSSMPLVYDAYGNPLRAPFPPKPFQQLAYRGPCACASTNQLDAHQCVLCTVRRRIVQLYRGKACGIEVNAQQNKLEPVALSAVDSADTLASKPAALPEVLCSALASAGVPAPPRLPSYALAGADLLGSAVGDALGEWHRREEQRLSETRYRGRRFLRCMAVEAPDADMDVEYDMHGAPVTTTHVKITTSAVPGARQLHDPFFPLRPATDCSLQSYRGLYHAHQHFHWTRAFALQQLRARTLASLAEFERAKALEERQRAADVELDRQMTVLVTIARLMDALAQQIVMHAEEVHDESAIQRLSQQLLLLERGARTLLTCMNLTPTTIEGGKGSVRVRSSASGDDTATRDEDNARRETLRNKVLLRYFHIIDVINQRQAQDRARGGKLSGKAGAKSDIRAGDRAEAQAGVAKKSSSKHAKGKAYKRADKHARAAALAEDVLSQLSPPSHTFAAEEQMPQSPTTCVPSLPAHVPPHMSVPAALAEPIVRAPPAAPSSPFTAPGPRTAPYDPTRVLPATGAASADGTAMGTPVHTGYMAGISGEMRGHLPVSAPTQLPETPAPASHMPLTVLSSPSRVPNYVAPPPADDATANAAAVVSFTAAASPVADTPLSRPAPVVAVVSTPVAPSVAFPAPTLIQQHSMHLSATSSPAPPNAQPHMYIERAASPSGFSSAPRANSPTLPRPIDWATAQCVQPGPQASTSVPRTPTHLFHNSHAHPAQPHEYALLGAHHSSSFYPPHTQLHATPVSHTLQTPAARVSPALSHHPSPVLAQSPQSLAYAYPPRTATPQQHAFIPQQRMHMHAQPLSPGMPTQTLYGLLPAHQYPLVSPAAMSSPAFVAGIAPQPTHSLAASRVVASTGFAPPQGAAVHPSSYAQPYPQPQCYVTLPMNPPPPVPLHTPMPSAPLVVPKHSPGYTAPAPPAAPYGDPVSLVPRGNKRPADAVADSPLLSALASDPQTRGDTTDLSVKRMRLDEGDGPLPPPPVPPSPALTSASWPPSTFNALTLDEDEVSFSAASEHGMSITPTDSVHEELVGGVQRDDRRSDAEITTDTAKTQLLLRALAIAERCGIASVADYLAPHVAYQGRAHLHADLPELGNPPTLGIADDGSVTDPPALLARARAVLGEAALLAEVQGELAPSSPLLAEYYRLFVRATENPRTMTSASAFELANMIWKRHFRHLQFYTSGDVTDPMFIHEYTHELAYYDDLWRLHVREASKKKKTCNVSTPPLFIAESRYGSSRCESYMVSKARHAQWKWVQRQTHLYIKQVEDALNDKKKRKKYGAAPLCRERVIPKKTVYRNTSTLWIANSTIASQTTVSASDFGASEGMERDKRVSARTTLSSTYYDAVGSRTKMIRFTRSPIHDWGVYVMERVAKGDVIMEYVGEVTRDVLGDVREHNYERSGIDSSYLFRLNEEFIIDATKKGNIARFVNHSCDPNSYPRAFTHGGRARIFIFAARDIEPGEEVVYDYKFPEEYIKIKCMCGSAKCRGFLN